MARKQGEAPARRRSALLLGGLGVAAIFALGILAFSLWLADDPGATQATPAAVGQEQTAAPADEPPAPAAELTDDGAVTPVPVPGRAILAGNDPFAPVVPDEAGVTAAAGTDPVPADDEAPRDPSANESPAPTPVPEQPEPEGCVVTDQAVTCDGDRVALGDLYEDEDGARLAVIQVGTTMHEVRVGDTFAGDYVLLAINGTCVDVVHPSGGLRLCLDETVLK